MLGGEGRLHGFAPAGWETGSSPLATISVDRLRDGWDWSFGKEYQRGVAAGLAYLKLPAQALTGGVLRAQLVPRAEEEETFPEIPGSTEMAGGCHGKLVIAGTKDTLDVQFEPAQVRIARGAPETVDGKRTVRLGIEIRVGGAFVPTVGSVDVEVLPEVNPGSVVPLGEDSDFPATMTMRIRKRYVTPVGPLLGEVEEYAGEIKSFPPYGAALEPVTKKVKLFNEDSGQEVATFFPGTVTPLFPLDPMDFPLSHLPPIWSLRNSEARS